MRRVPVLGLLCVGLIAPAASSRAESTSAQGNSALSAAASVDFKIVIPEVLALRVVPSVIAASDASLTAASAQVRVARGGLKLGLSAAGAAGGIALASNMRQVTVIQESGPRTTVTVTTP